MNFKGKYFLIFLFIILSSATGALITESSESYPSPRGYVNDFSNVISAGAENQIISLCSAVKEKTGIEISVVFIDSTKPVDIELYAVKLFEKWGIGEKKKDNGILFISAVGDRKARIEVGYGLEGIITDGYCGEVLDRVIPYFASGNYDNGAFVAVAGIVSKIAKEYNIDFEGVKPVRKYSSSKRVNPFKNIFGTLFFLFFVFTRLGFVPFFRGRRRYGLGGYRAGGFGGSGGSFGGFGGFGGGMSGGGGASRSW